MQYDLLDSHKELAQRIVGRYRSGGLNGEFTLSPGPDGDLHLMLMETPNQTKYLSVSVISIEALAKEKLILIKEYGRRLHCSLLPRIFVAVDTNFGEIETNLKSRSEDLGGLGLNIPKFSQLLARDFNLKELDELLFNMGIESEDIPGSGRDEKTRETVKYAQRHGRLLELLIRSAKLRSRTDWSQLYE